MEVDNYEQEQALLIPYDYTCNYTCVLCYIAVQEGGEIDTCHSCIQRIGNKL